MKTAISIPDRTFDEAERAAEQLGISRSEFFTRAAQMLIRETHERSVTEQINAVLDRSGEENSTDITAYSRRALNPGDDDW